MSDNSLKLIARIAERFGVDSHKMYDALKQTAFRLRDGSAPTNEQMMALLIVADQHGLNPFTKEIVAFSGKAGQVVPVVTVDGWARIINDHPQLDGIEFRYSENLVTPPDGQLSPEWIECLIYRKDRSLPVLVREYLDEVYVPTRSSFGGPWQTHTKRMMRHKSLIQCSRLAFGFSGIYDADEANRILEPTTNLPRSINHQSQSLELLDKQIADARQRINTMGLPAVESYIRGRHKGGDLEYILAGLTSEQLSLPKNIEDHSSAGISDALIEHDEPWPEEVLN